MMEVEKYYKLIPDNLLYTYLRYVQDKDYEKLKPLLQDVLTETGISLSIKNIEENLLREVARRWVLSHKEQKYRYVKCASCEEVIAYTNDYYTTLKDAFDMGATMWKCPVCGVTDLLDDALKRKVDEE